MATLSSISDFSRVHQKWIWLLLLGIAFIVLGLVSFVFTPAATLASVVVFGWIVIISGIVEGVQSFYVRRWQGVFLHLIAGLLGILVGFLIVTHPIAGALAWTPLFAAFFTVLGFFGWWELSFSSSPRGPGLSSTESSGLCSAFFHGRNGRGPASGFWASRSASS
jgi:uncharacterized membrane protein HdeD (DUF308 family)